MGKTSPVFINGHKGPPLVYRAVGPCKYGTAPISRCTLQMKGAIGPCCGHLRWPRAGSSPFGECLQGLGCFQKQKGSTELQWTLFMGPFFLGPVVGRATARALNFV